MKKIIVLLLCFALCFSACGSPDVEITLPASFFEEGTTQESIDAVNDGKFKSAVLNEDGSVTYVLTASQHKELMDGLKTQMQSSFDELIADDTYSINSVTPNSDYTEFKVELSTDTLSFVDSISVMAFYSFGAMYNMCNGTPAENISVVFVNPNGDVIQTANSSDMGQ